MMARFAWVRAFRVRATTVVAATDGWQRGCSAFAHASSGGVHRLAMRDTLADYCLYECSRIILRQAAEFTADARGVHPLRGGFTNRLRIHKGTANN